MKKIGELLISPSKGPKKRKEPAIDEKTVLFITGKIISDQYGMRGKENIIPKTWKDKRLFLAFRSSLWMNEVWMEKESLKEKINRKLGSEEVVDIKASEIW